MLLDAPPQTLAALYRLGGAEAVAQIELVLLSHLHADHILGMDLLLLELEQGAASRLRGERPLAVAGPPGTHSRLRGIVGRSDRLPERADPRIVWIEDDAPSRFAWGDLEVEHIEVAHDPRLTAHGYRVHLDGRVVAYTGDTRMCPAVDALAEDADVLIVECAGAPREGAVATHLDWPEVYALRERLPARTRILVTHYDHLAAPAVEALPAGIVLAEDGRTYPFD
ncbi:MAG: hypothetical protein IT299_03545 [Dehalococcoidia bacterium]|nr:hypothetical protein [Dehalococcoidia bacterium]